MLTFYGECNIITIEREVVRMITKVQYLVIDNWLKEKSFQNFKTLFVFGFNLKGWQRPIWKCWQRDRLTLQGVELKRRWLPIKEATKY